MQKLEKQNMMTQIKSNIKESDLVFFDFFETLVHRTVSEIDLVEAWAYNLSSIIKYKVSAKDLVRYRYKAVKSVYKTGNKEEYSYDEIMRELYCSCHTQLLDFNYDEFYELSRKTEIKVELASQEVREDIFEIVHYAKTEGKKVGIISDFYFGKKEIEVFLDDKNVDPSIFDFIFVSSEFGKKKASGNLYKIVASTVGNEKKCVMVGDNFIADIKMSEGNGFRSYQVSSIMRKKHNSLNRSIKTLQKKYKMKPFANYAFGFYYYIEQIYFNAVKSGYKKLVFLSREGFLLKKMFDIYQEGKNNKIDTRYLYVSRLSTFLPSLNSLDVEKFDVIFKQYGDISLTAFLKNLQFDDATIETISKQENIEKDKIIIDFGHSNQFYKIKENNLFVQTYETLVAQEKEKLRRYINQVVGEDDTIVLVDIGWKGTMQDNLYKLWNGERDFVGLYYGIFNHSGNECNHNIKKGLVFDKYPERSPNYYVWEFETHLIEQLLAAPHGSTIGYDCFENRIEPQFLLTEDDANLYNLVKPIQLNLIQLFSEIVDTFQGRAENSNDYFKQITRIQLKCELVITSCMISFEENALSEKTNNFGWFSQVPVNLSKDKSSKIKKILRDLKNIHIQDGGTSFIKYLSYVSIKMNAREKYGWKILAYRLFYLPEYFLVRR